MCLLVFLSVSWRSGSRSHGNLLSLGSNSSPRQSFSVLSKIASLYIPYQFCGVFQAVPLCHASANTFRPRAPPFWANTSGRGPTKQFTAGRQLGLVQIRIALQEGCVSIVVIHSQINKDKGNKQLIVAWIQFPFKSVLTGLPER